MKKSITILLIIILSITGIKIDNTKAALVTSMTSFWNMDGNSNDAYSTNNGTDTNVAYSASYGKIGQGAYYNGSTAKTTTGYSFPTNTSAKSFSVWFYDLDATNDRGWIVAGGTDSNAQAFGAFVQNTTSIYFHGNGATDLLITSSYTGNAWHHLVVTYDGITLKTYLDGAAGPSAARTLSTTGSGVWFGARKNGDANGWFYGYIDAIGVWSKELSTTEVAELYNSGSGIQYPFPSGSTLKANLIMFE